MAASQEHVPIVVASIDGKTPRYLHPHLTAFEHEEHDGKTRVTLTFATSDGEDAADLLGVTIGARIRLRWGYVGALSEPTTVVVIGVKPDYKAGTLKVIARDRSHALAQGGAKFAVFRNRTVAQVAKDIAAAHGMTVQFPSPPASKPKRGSAGHGRKKIQPSSTAGGADVRAVLGAVYNDVHRGKTDLDLLHTIAARAGCEVQVDTTRSATGAVFVFAPRPHKAPPARVVWHRATGGEIIDFDVEEGTPKGATKAGKGAKAVTVDPLEQKVLTEFKGARERKGRPVLGQAAPLGGLLGDGLRRAGNLFITAEKRAGVAVRAETAAMDDARAALTSPEARGLVDALSPSIRPTFGKLAQVVGAFIAAPSAGAPSDGNKAKQAATAAHAAGEQEAVKAKATLYGDPTLRRRMVLDIRGTRGRDGGRWMIVGVRHLIDPSKGYTTVLDLRRHGQGTLRRREARTTGSTAKGQKPQAAPRRGKTWIVTSTGTVVGVRR